jgi:hypothetical protein
VTVTEPAAVETGSGWRWSVQGRLMRSSIRVIVTTGHALSAQMEQLCPGSIIEICHG